MKNIVKWIVPLLLAAVAAGCGTERRSALEAYRSWPKGLSVSLTMPADKLQQVKEAGFGHVEVTLNFAAREIHGGAARGHRAFPRRCRAGRADCLSVHLPFGPRLGHQFAERFAAHGGRGADRLVHRRRTGARTPENGSASQRGTDRRLAARRSFREQREFDQRAGRGGPRYRRPSCWSRTCRGPVSATPRTKCWPCSGGWTLRSASVSTPIICCRRLPRLSPGPWAAASPASTCRTTMPWMKKHWVMGKGVIDWPAVIGAIASTGYDGVFMFEVGGYDSFGQVADTWRAVERRLEEIENRK